MAGSERTVRLPSSRAPDDGRDRLLGALVAGLPPLLGELAETLADVLPDYSAFVRDNLDEVTSTGRLGIERLVELAREIAATGTGPLPRSDEPEVQHAVFEEIGRAQWREGRELRSLLAAYQVGSRLAWRHISRTALGAGVDAGGLAALAEALFLLVDQLSSASAEGFLQEQTDAAGARARMRDELVELLLSDRSDTGAVAAAAARAGWRLPVKAAVVFLDPTLPAAERIVSRLEPSMLPVRRLRMLGAIVPDPPEQGRRERLATRLQGAGAVIGPLVPVKDLPASLHVAEAAALLRRSGVLREDPLFVDEHLDAIIVWRDPALLAALREQVLRPLDGLAPATRERLVQTLASWLLHLGDRQAVASELHVHPQTVRYRMGQLHDRFGDSLQDPAVRARLVLALAWSPSA
ncbi:PucR-like helix-turn-helix protein [Motilibacter peucedani]|uniref:PucR-like helix-turn-helix protein n=1 Tax=Motilibacter peucedani TaxID=598650 RepID=A0A420XKD9_9ACTN|nr:helix-turn-helix domain-containing protein [Motilibacter peucedani]RKS67985.1 PucR-like helix-turn-helix protein [Motilibacter peucedani]